MASFVPTDSSSKNLSLIHRRDNVVNPRLKLKQLRQRSADKNHDVGDAPKEVSEAEDLLKSQISDDFASRSVENKAAKNKLEYMEKKVQEIEKDFASIAENRVTYERLRREFENQSAMYKKIQEELKSARIVAQMSIHKTANIYMIDKAVPPLKPVRPNKLLDVTLGLSGEIVIGIGVIMLSAYLDETMMKPHQVR